MPAVRYYARVTTPRRRLLLLLVLMTGCSAQASEVTATLSLLRPDSPNTNELPPVFASSDDVERFDSKAGMFRVHFTRAGRHAVPATDADSDGIPDYVQLVAAEYDAVGEFYEKELGFDRPPSDATLSDDNGGDGRFDVYLLDFTVSADGSFVAENCASPSAHRCPGYMKHENDFNGRNYPTLARATRILASHEYFHAVQDGYDAKSGVVISEGTAVWASETYDPTLSDLEGFAGGYLDRTDRSLGQEPTGPDDRFSYGSSLFFQFLSERYDRDVILELWEALREDAAGATKSSWVSALDRTLRGAYASSLQDAFAEFTRWNLYTASRTDPSVAYARGAGYPALKATEVTLPFEDPRPRIFPLAAKVYSARVQKAGTQRLALRSEASPDGLRLLLAREAGGKVVDVKEARAEAEPSVDLDAVEAGDTIIAAVINTRLEGESQRPDVCLGAIADTKACAGDGDEGKAGADSGVDARDDNRKADSGCAVVALGSPGSAFGGWIAMLAWGLLVVVKTRRSRRLCV